MNPVLADEVRHSVQEVLDEIDAVARARCGMSAEEFIAAYRNGKLENPGGMADVIVLLDLLPSEILSGPAS